MDARNHSQLNMSNDSRPLASYSKEEILSCIENGDTITTRCVLEEMRKARRNTVLNQHEYRIYQDNKGRWCTYAPDEKTGRKKFVKKTEADLIDALYDHYTNSQFNNMSLRELYPLWHHFKSLYLRKASLTRFDSDWARFYDKSPIVDIPIRNLTKNQLEEWVREIAAVNKMDKKQYSNFVSILKQELEYAEEKGIIEVSPFRRVKVTSRQLRSRKIKPDFTQVYSPDELENLKKMALEDYENDTFTAHPLAPLAIVFMFLTGIRIGEVVGLKFTDIYDTKMLVQRMVQYPDGEIIDDTKGDFGPRFVLLIPEAIQLIETAKQYQKDHQIRSELIFCTTDNPIRTYWSIQRAFRKYCQKMNIVTKSAHKARKTYISVCIDEGINARTVAQQVGHKDVRTTLNNYYYDRRSEQEQIRQLEKAFSGN